MAHATVCSDTSEAIELFEPQGLYLKPIARVNISVQLPQMKTPGKSISNWEVMEKIKTMIKPDVCVTLKIVKSTLEFIRLEGEIENKSQLKNVISRLDTKVIKLSGYPDILKVRAGEAKVIFPVRHDWEAFFRDAKNMNEMRPGERPDTIHFKDLPTRWFATRKDKDKASEQVLRRVFTGFGEVRCVDIPMLDPYRREIATQGKINSIQTFSFGQDLTFEAFVQFKEYIGFVKAMDSLRGMKLLYKDEDGKALAANFKVEFDKSKHLSDRAIKRRRLEKQKLQELERLREEEVRLQKEEEERKKEEERRRQEEEDRDRERRRQEKIDKKEARRKEREHKRWDRRLLKKKKEEEKKMQLKIALEERKLLIAQRKLESLRLLSELFDRVKVIKCKEDLEKREAELEEERKRLLEKEKQKKIQDDKKRKESLKRKKEKLEVQEKELREKILKNYHANEEKQQEEARELLRKRLKGKGKKLKSAVVISRPSWR